MRLNEVLNDARQYEFREQIACADELLMEIASQTKLHTLKHLNFLQKCLGYGPKQAKKWLQIKSEAEIVEALKASMKRA